MFAKLCLLTTVVACVRASMDITQLQWVIIELVSAKVETTNLHKCLKLNAYVHPRLALEVLDSTGESRFVNWDVQVRGRG